MIRRTLNTNQGVDPGITLVDYLIETVKDIIQKKHTTLQKLERNNGGTSNCTHRDNTLL